VALNPPLNCNVMSEAAGFDDAGTATHRRTSIVQCVVIVWRHFSTTSIGNTCNISATAGSGIQLGVRVTVKPNNVICSSMAHCMILASGYSSCS